MPKKLVIPLLLFICLAPLVGAGGYYYYSQFNPPAQTHRGQLLLPPKQYPELTEKNWHLIYLGNNTNQLQTLWVALGKDMPRVTRHMLAKQSDYPGIALLQFSLEKVKSLQDQGTWFIADPAGYIIMAYGRSAPLDDIYKDLKTLLKVSRVG